MSSEAFRRGLGEVGYVEGRNVAIEYRYAQGQATVRGIRRTLGTAKIKKAPATAERLLAMAANTGADLKGLRDRA